MSRPYRTREDERDVFRALAHPVRRQMIVAALDHACSFDQMKQLVRRSKATVAEHLRIMREARLLDVTRSGKSVSYQVNRATLRASARWLADVALSTQADKLGASRRSDAA